MTYRTGRNRLSGVNCKAAASNGETWKARKGQMDSDAVA